ncbi:tetratricopeptide repeat protein [Rhodothermus profundi]|uniref:Tfp pilus assembly protein PilF n=1 Tax=Rhodothermus profundi TaxID=633813 RepID=A0A1M6WDN4_9BACT|nr:tetratricopeptide repeat protein [Rhodothermus profundi]SHK91696.1 Tfp pilus assembly protein PilF [Rhodothermus profundi]
MLRTLVYGGLVGVLVLLEMGCGENNPMPASSSLLPAQQRAPLQQAWQAYEAGDYHRAMRLVDSLLAQEAVAEAYFLKGRILLDANAFEKAIAAFQQARVRDPLLRGVYFQLGHAAFLQGAYRKALDYYLKELELIQASAERSYESQAERNVLAAIYRQAGRACFLLDSLEAARRFYMQALAADSTESETYRWLAELEEQEGRLAQALTFAERALQLNPGHLDNLYAFGRLLLQNGYLQDAVHFLRLVLARYPLHRGANYNLGRALMRLGEREAGQFFLERAHRIQQLSGKIGQARLNAYQSQSARPWQELATLLMQAGQYEEARKALDVAIFWDPDNLALQNDRANLALLLGDTLDAVRRYYQVLQRDSTLADVWLNLGVVLAAQKHYEAARRAWLQALHYRPNDDTLRQYLAELEHRK